jgi:hypothetical protein
MKKRKPNLQELIVINKEQIKEDLKELEKIENKIEERHIKRLQIS